VKRRAAARSARANAAPRRPRRRHRRAGEVERRPGIGGSENGPERLGGDNERSPTTTPHFFYLKES